jgi:hypothetical protein
VPRSTGTCPIDRAIIDEPAALWHVYDDYAELAAFEGKTWRELAPELLYKHSMLLVFAGDDLWRATLPGYLWYLIHERTQFNALPFQVASQCPTTNRESHPHSLAWCTAPRSSSVPDRASQYWNHTQRPGGQHCLAPTTAMPSSGGLAASSSCPRSPRRRRRRTLPVAAGRCDHRRSSSFGARAPRNVITVVRRPGVRRRSRRNIATLTSASRQSESSSTALPFRNAAAAR